MMILIPAFLIGLFCGLRSLTAPAVTAWAAHLGWLRLEGHLSLIGTWPSVMIFTLVALVELVADKLPQTPSRTAAPGLIARILMGALTGACVSSAGGQGIFGALMGALGGMVGCFGGYWTRARAVKVIGTHDLNVALIEDLIAVGGSVWVVASV